MTRIEVAAAVLEREDGRFLLAQRPSGKAYAGYWEFPGGKIEPGEAAVDALARELHEELGIEIKRAFPWLTRDYDYEHAAVRLRFFRVTAWNGEPHGRENQRFAWQHIEAISVSPLLPANGPVLRALALPALYGISNAAEVGTSVFLKNLELAFRRGLRLVGIREKTLDDGEVSRLVRGSLELASRHTAAVLMNGDLALARKLGVDGIHLSAARLIALNGRPDFRLVGASCHDKAELAHAADLPVDFVVLGPVADTPSHPGACPLGWARFREMAAGYSLPVYAIGGLQQRHLDAAREAGAHGVAAIRGCWVE